MVEQDPGEIIELRPWKQIGIGVCVPNGAEPDTKLGWKGG